MEPTIANIILVEDNRHDAELTIRALKKGGVAGTILHLNDGEEAMDYFFGSGAFATRKTGDTPKLVLLDIKMPKLDGIEVLKRLKADAATRIIPVVLLTSSQEERDILETYNLGANSYIVKPVDFDGFQQAIAGLGIYWLLLNQSPNNT